MFPGKKLDKRQQVWVMTFQVKSNFHDEYIEYAEAYPSQIEALEATEDHEGEYICLFGRYFDSVLGKVNTISYNSHEIEDLLMEVQADAA